MKRKLVGFIASFVFALLFCLTQTVTVRAQMGFGNLDKFEASLEAGATIVLGRKLNVESEIDPLIEVLERNPELKDQLINDPKYTAGFKAIKLLLADQKSSALRSEVINRVFQETHGRSSTAMEQAEYDAQMKQQKKWYAVMLSAERDHLHDDAKLRTAMLNRAYLFSMGRETNADDLKYWLPRYEHYTQVVGACRDWLYSPNGANDLIATVTYYLKIINNKDPNDALVKKTMTAVSTNRLIFNEMLKSKIGKL